MGSQSWEPLASTAFLSGKSECVHHGFQAELRRQGTGETSLMEFFELDETEAVDQDGEEVEEGEDPNLELKDDRRPFGASSSTLDLLQVPWQELA